MKDSNLSQSACECADENTTTLPKRMRTTLSGCGCRCAHRADVIYVRIVECHASIHVVIGIRVVLCHPLLDFPLFWIFTS